MTTKICDKLSIKIFVIKLKLQYFPEIMSVDKMIQDYVSNDIYIHRCDG